MPRPPWTKIHLRKVSKAMRPPVISVAVTAPIEDEVVAALILMVVVVIVADPKVPHDVVEVAAVHHDHSKKVPLFFPVKMKTKKIMILP